MRLGPDVLLEIVHIVQQGLMTGTDISQKLRDVDVRPTGLPEDVVVLTDEYKELRERG